MWEWNYDVFSAVRFTMPFGFTAAVATTMAVGTLAATAAVTTGLAAFSFLGTTETKLGAMAGVSGVAATLAFGVRTGGNGALDNVALDNILRVVEDGCQSGAYEEGEGCQSGKMHDEG